MMKFESVSIKFINYLIFSFTAESDKIVIPIPKLIPSPSYEEEELDCLEGMNNVLEGIPDDFVRKHLRHGGRANMLEEFYQLLKFSSFRSVRDKARPEFDRLMEIFREEAKDGK
jgi:hypothetical protein